MSFALYYFKRFIHIVVYSWCSFFSVVYVPVWDHCQGIFILSNTVDPLNDFKSFTSINDAAIYVPVYVSWHYVQEFLRGIYIAVKFINYKSYIIKTCLIGFQIFLLFSISTSSIWILWLCQIFCQILLLLYFLNIANFFCVCKMKLKVVLIFIFMVNNKIEDPFSFVITLGSFSIFVKYFFIFFVD